MATYNMIGGDGKEYGPVLAEQLRQWFTEGRVDRNTRVRAAGQAAWMALWEVTEFADLFVVPGAVSPPPAMPLPDNVPPAETTPPPSSPVNSGLAVASMITGILSLVCCGLLVIPAIICGHKARRDIAASQGTLTGDGMALAGLIIGYALIVIMLGLFLVAAFGFGAFHLP